MYGSLDIPVFATPYMFDSYAAKNSIKRIINSGAKNAAITHFGFVKDLNSFGTKAYEWARRMNDIATYSKYPELDVYGEYIKAFGSDFDLNPIARGHFKTNSLGVRSVWEYLHGVDSTLSPTYKNTN